MNHKIREAIQKAEVYQWQVAKELGISEATFIRWLRDELPAEKEAMIMAAIEKVRASNGR